MHLNFFSSILTQADQVQYYNPPVIESIEDSVYNLLGLINVQDILSKKKQIHRFLQEIRNERT